MYSTIYTHLRFKQNTILNDITSASGLQGRAKYGSSLDALNENETTRLLSGKLSYPTYYCIGSQQHAQCMGSGVHLLPTLKLTEGVTRTAERCSRTS